MSIYAVISKLQANALPYCEYVISTSADLASIPACAPGSVATLPNGLRYILSADGDWRFDYNQQGWPIEAAGDIPHVLHITEGDNSNLAVAVGATSKSDGDTAAYGDDLTVTYSGDTGYTATCVINGAAAGSSPVTYPVPIGDDVTIVTAATLNEYELTLTIGENTTLTVVDKAENEYNDGDFIPHGTVLTITAAAAEGYDLTTFTVGGVDKTSDNPYEHTMTDAVTIVTAATLNTYKLTLTIGAHTTLTVADAEDNEYANNDYIPHGTVLTITAAAAEGYDLTTFTVGGVDKTSDNPYEHTMTAALTIVTAATSQ